MCRPLSLPKRSAWRIIQLNRSVSQFHALRYSGCIDIQKVKQIFILNIISIQSELFQDDLFPPTRVTWIPTLSAGEWFNCRDKKAKKLSLQPEGMECCKYLLNTVDLASKIHFNWPNLPYDLVSSTLPVTQQPPLTPNKKTDHHAPASNILQSYNRQINTDSEKYKQEEVKTSQCPDWNEFSIEITSLCPLQIQKSVSARMEYTTVLEQDSMEGVDADEWNE